MRNWKNSAMMLSCDLQGANGRLTFSLPFGGVEGSATRGDQVPVAALDLEHAESREVETKMIGGRHVHDATSANEALGLLDLVADLLGIGRVRALHGLDQDEEAVIGVTAEGRDRLLGRALVSLLVFGHDLLLRIALRQ